MNSGAVFKDLSEVQKCTALVLHNKNNVCKNIKAFHGTKHFVAF